MDFSYDSEIIKRILDCYKRLEKEPEKCIFNSISNVFYRENFHSDILAYYLSYDIVKMKLADWINRWFDKKQKRERIDFSLYKGGPDPKREEGRRDITIYSKYKKHAIIIENKSNGADDKTLQIPRYYVALIAAGYIVDAIVYLNQKDLKAPDEVWTEQNIFDLFQEKKRNISLSKASDYLDDIHQKLVLMTLNSDNGFTQEVIEQVLSDDSVCERIKGLSLEIQSLFRNVVNGVYQLNITDVFKEKNDFKNFIKFVNDMPYCMAQYVKDTLNKNLNINARKIKEVVYVDFSYNDNAFYIDFDFLNVMNNELIIRVANREKNNPDPVDVEKYENNIKDIMLNINKDRREMYKLYVKDRFIQCNICPVSMVDENNSLLKDMTNILKDFCIVE